MKFLCMWHIKGSYEGLWRPLAKTCEISKGIFCFSAKKYEDNYLLIMIFVIRKIVRNKERFFGGKESK